MTMDADQGPAALRPTVPPPSSTCTRKSPCSSPGLINHPPSSNKPCPRPTSQWCFFDIPNPKTGAIDMTPKKHSKKNKHPVRPVLVHAKS
ncbi:uncharacterized protein B0I36DRAFT_90854 [Microdochium trichocladiopsis]|uniref:Uncharacterized protein n=1 Tax=Microdochium trichocladiopsis TaxID=1682393 RepID=A0A9P8YE60_9PEZI|nr:uncharacterized protein B0I36DRAFT_90854 [Microdochium trichocladiopsis]KAH7035306.1 hypothetical protein B0I36DRAFT_90854 [Microdochium trichocladiopsis]